jgi:hypothetical protein
MSRNFAGVEKNKMLAIQNVYSKASNVFTALLGQGTSISVHRPLPHASVATATTWRELILTDF